MKKQLVTFLMLSILIFGGCKDISDSYKPGSFGKTSEEKQVVDSITTKYGDLTKDGKPRFLEVTMATKTVNAIPVDKVSKFSKDEPKLLVWFVYDNFDTDALDIEWTYLDEDYSIHTFKSETGKDLGRGTFILEQPDEGWPLGNYKVTISGAGATQTKTFEIIDGPTVSVPFTIDGIVAGEAASGEEETENNKPGWYLVKVTDFDEVPEDNNGYYDFSSIYERPSITTSTSGDKGENLVVKTVWEEPPEYMAAEEEIELTMKREAVNVELGGLTLKHTASVTFDIADIVPGGATASKYRLSDDKFGQEIIVGSGQTQSVTALMKGKAPKQGYCGGKMSLTYGFFTTFIKNGARYEYEWRE